MIFTWISKVVRVSISGFFSVVFRSEPFVAEVCLDLPAEEFPEVEFAIVEVRLANT